MNSGQPLLVFCHLPLSSKSLMNKLDYSGPRINCWGTPVLTGLLKYGEMMQMKH